MLRWVWTISDIADVDGNVLGGMAYLAAKAKLVSQDVNNVFMKQVGPDYFKPAS